MSWGAELRYPQCVTILENISLAQYTTLGVGGPARWFIKTSDEEEMLAAVRLARAHAVPHFVLGGGSNLLVSDDGFPGVVIHVSGGGSMWQDEENGFGNIVSAAGTEWDSVVRLAVEKNCAGIECLAGIPGSVGGTPVQNVGAYGQEVSRTILSVRALDLEAEKVLNLTTEQCGFAYRSSIFNSSQKGRYIITSVVYGLEVGGKPYLEYRDVKQYFQERGIAHPSLAEVADAVRSIRKQKGMLLVEGDADVHSAGSFFKNPVVPMEVVPRLAVLAHCRPDEVPQFPPGGGDVTGKTVKLSAAWLMELAGFHKGFAMGHAGISSKHVLALINRGGATASEILALRDAIVNAVYEKTSIRLVQEPVMLGFAAPR